VSIAFVEFRAVLDSVDRQALCLILELTGLPEKHFSLFKALHHWPENCIYVTSKSPFFQGVNLVCQGCAVASQLVDYFMIKITSCARSGPKDRNRFILDVRFADDWAFWLVRWNNAGSASEKEGLTKAGPQIIEIKPKHDCLSI